MITFAPQFALPVHLANHGVLDRLKVCPLKGASCRKSCVTRAHLKMVRLITHEEVAMLLFVLRNRDQ